MVGMWRPPDIVDRTEKAPSHYGVRNRMSAQVDTVVLHYISFARCSVSRRSTSQSTHTMSFLPKRHTTPLCNSIQSTRISFFERLRRRCHIGRGRQRFFD